MLSRVLLHNLSESYEVCINIFAGADGVMDSDFYLGVRLELRCTTFCVCASGSQFYRERGNDGNENRRCSTGMCVPYFSVCLYEQV